MRLGQRPWHSSDGRSAIGHEGSDSLPIIWSRFADGRRDQLEVPSEGIHRKFASVENAREPVHVADEASGLTIEVVNEPRDQVGIVVGAERPSALAEALDVVGELGVVRRADLFGQGQESRREQRIRRPDR